MLMWFLFRLGVGVRQFISYSIASILIIVYRFNRIHWFLYAGCHKRPSVRSSTRRAAIFENKLVLPPGRSWTLNCIKLPSLLINYWRHLNTVIFLNTVLSFFLVARIMRTKRPKRTKGTKDKRFRKRPG